MTLRIGSVCTGYGGLDLAVQQVLGGHLAWVADPDPGASAILTHHHPDTPNLGDITAVDWEEMYPMAAHRNNELAQQMYDRYCQGLSVEQVAAEFGRTRQTVWRMFQRRQLDLRERPPARPNVTYNGRTFSLRNNGYYAATDGRREFLHRVVWQDANGPIPEGSDIHHRDHDKTNNALDNLLCLTKAEHTALHWGEVVPADSPATIDILTAGYPPAVPAVQRRRPAKRNR